MTRFLKTALIFTVGLVLGASLGLKGSLYKTSHAVMLAKPSPVVQASTPSHFPAQQSSMVGHLKSHSTILLASWYGGAYQGRPTASGELYDKNKLTAASRTLKFNTNIRVCRLNQTDKCVWLRITDRGPYVDGRDLDVSEAGAVALGFREAGLAKLQIVEMVPPARKTRRGF